MEAELLDWIRQNTKHLLGDQLLLQDDAAVVKDLSTNSAIVSVDLLSDLVDFDLSVHSPERVGHKILAVNLSDLAAMGAIPTGCVIALCLPNENALELGKGLYRGLIPLAEKYHVPLIGGDINTWEGPFTASVTVFGKPFQEDGNAKILTRSNASPDDRILVTGSFGGSILRHHLDFQPRLSEIHWLLERFSVNACMDVSDGLSLDLSRLAKASQLGAVIDLDKVPIREDVHELNETGKTPIQHALSDGEDFELILACSPEEAKSILECTQLPCEITDIGYFREQKGLFQTENGTITELTPVGYLH